MDYFQVLKVSRSASDEDVEVAYKKQIEEHAAENYRQLLMETWESEKIIEACEAVQLTIQEAYEELRNSEKREDYLSKLNQDNWTPEERAKQTELSNIWKTFTSRCGKFYNYQDNPESHIRYLQSQFALAKQEKELQKRWTRQLAEQTVRNKQLESRLNAALRDNEALHAQLTRIGGRRRSNTPAPRAAGLSFTHFSSSPLETLGKLNATGLCIERYVVKNTNNPNQTELADVNLAFDTQENMLKFMDEFKKVEHHPFRPRCKQLPYKNSLTIEFDMGGCYSNNGSFEGAISSAGGICNFIYNFVAKILPEQTPRKKIELNDVSINNHYKRSNRSFTQ